MDKKSTYTLHHSNIIFSYADTMHWKLFELQTPRNCLTSIWIFIVLPIFLLSHMHHDHIHMNECWIMSMWYIIYIYIERYFYCSCIRVYIAAIIHKTWYGYNDSMWEREKEKKKNKTITPMNENEKINK